MGSGKVCEAPHLTMAEKKSIKNIIIKPLQALFNKKKDKHNKERKEKVDDLQENFEKLNLKKDVDKINKNEEEIKQKESNSKDPELDNFTFKQVEDDDELNNFPVKVIEEDRRSARIDSHSSQDSGFQDKDAPSDTDADDVIEGFKKLNVVEEKEGRDDGKEKKKLQTVVLSRAPIRNRLGDYAVHPYLHENVGQINQINKHSLSGGHVTVAQRLDNFIELNEALHTAELSSPKLDNPQQADDYLDIVQEYIDEEAKPILHTPDVRAPSIPSPESPENLLEGFIAENIGDLHNFVQNEITKITETNAIDDFSNHIIFEQYDGVASSLQPYSDEYFGSNECGNVYPTPPRSEDVLSPMSDSHSSFYPTNSEYTLSPALSPPNNSDYEKYQEITHEEQYPSCISEGLETEQTTDKKERERNSSTSSMTMKQYKDLQKELSTSFSKKECCQLNRKSCKQIFQEHVQKLKIEHRKSLCLEVANLDLKHAHGLLQNILLSLAHGSEKVDLQYALFGLICERVLAQEPALFLDDFGLSLLKAAALRCGRRPLLARYLVQCVRTAAATTPVRDCIFREIDAQGDNLLHACVRAGDACAGVLSELVGGDGPPLFGVHHSNADGYTALHVACRLHSADTPCLHAAHVLLEHGGADLWKGDVKGGDTPVHLAVNSPSCDLRLVMVMFRHVDRKMWKKLAHTPNRSSVTPLEYARCATKSTTRQNYPPEVLEFLKKCR